MPSSSQLALKSGVLQATVRGLPVRSLPLAARREPRVC